MRSSSYQWIRRFIMSSLGLLCLLGSLVMYSKPYFKLTPLSTYKVSQKEDAYHNILSMERDTSQVLNPRVTEDDVLILMWSWPFGYKFNLGCSEFNIKGCQVTDDRSLYNKAHAVLFDHRDIALEPNNTPQQPRPWFQKWVWFNMESPANSPQIPKLNDLFNLTCSYRLDSNVPVPYRYLAPVTHEDESFKLPVKDKLLCWVVSNWKPRFKRVQFYTELKKHIQIEAYGKAFSHNLTREELFTVISSCKFYLSFENSIYKDYITEKLYNPMQVGTVPVVLGTSRRNYEDHVPGDSFIHVDDFATPKELADRLTYLHNNHAEYMNYFIWRERFKVKLCYLGHDHVCKICKHLQMNKGCQAFHDLNKWYWPKVATTTAGLPSFTTDLLYNLQSVTSERKEIN